MRQEDFSLYKHFGRFMGQQVPLHSKNYRDLKKKARELGLQTRFMASNKMKQSAETNSERLTIGLDEKHKYISVISIG